MKKKIVTLALQGGGSHGAFTWGILDRLLEDQRIEIEGISGASAGAMNAVVLAHGLTVGGRAGARQAMRDFWESVASKVPVDFMRDEVSGAGSAGIPPTISNPALSNFMLMTRFFSPSQLNPFNLNPLRDILAGQVDFDRLRRHSKLKLFIATTQVSSGKLKLFQNAQLTLEVLLASACLPELQQGVEIDGELYWDGGLTANPPIFPLVHHCTARDLMMILLHPCRWPDTPKTANEISQRLTEIAFSASFFTELQGLALAKQAAERELFSVGRLERRLRHLNMHLLDSQELMAQLSTTSKLNAHSSFINALHQEGRERAETWLAENFKHIGVRPSFRLAKLLT